MFIYLFFVHSNETRQEKNAERGENIRQDKGKEAALRSNRTNWRVEENVWRAPRAVKSRRNQRKK